MSEPECSNCFYWRLRRGIPPEQGGGECHRGPPDQVTGWPKVGLGPEWWCGEHRPKGDEP